MMAWNHLKGLEWPISKLKGSLLQVKHNIYFFVHFTSFVCSCIISISSFRSISIFCLSLTFVYNVWQGFHFIHLRKLCGQRLSLSVSSLKVCDRAAKKFVPIHLSFASNFLIHWTALLHTVKIIMDRISKRSKGYAFVEYTTEEAGGAALKAMNGQVGD